MFDFAKATLLYLHKLSLGSSGFCTFQLVDMVMGRMGKKIYIYIYLHLTLHFGVESWVPKREQGAICRGMCLWMVV